jgi:hypothetical protein
MAKRKRKQSWHGLSGGWTVVPLRQRKGPAPGALDRYREADRSLYPELDRIRQEEHQSPTAAARQLAEAGKVAGTGTSTAESRARRLARRYLNDIKNSRWRAR